MLLNRKYIHLVSHIWESRGTIIHYIRGCISRLALGVTLFHENLKCTGPSIDYPVSSADIYGCSGDPK